MRNFKMLCVVFMAVLLLFASGCGGGSSTENKPAPKPAPAPKTSEASLTGQWNSLKTDSQGNVIRISILDIVDDKSGNFQTMELTASEFEDVTQIFWKVDNIPIVIDRHKNTLKISAEGADDVDLMECTFDSSAQKLTTNIEMTFSKDSIEVESLKERSIREYEKNFSQQAKRVEIIGDMSSSQYKSYLNKKLFGI